MIRQFETRSAPGQAGAANLERVWLFPISLSEGITSTRVA